MKSTDCMDSLWLNEQICHLQITALVRPLNRGFSAIMY